MAGTAFRSLRGKNVDIAKFLARTGSRISGAAATEGCYMPYLIGSTAPLKDQKRSIARLLWSRRGDATKARGRRRIIGEAVNFTLILQMSQRP